MFQGTDLFKRKSLIVRQEEQVSSALLWMNLARMQNSMLTKGRKPRVCMLDQYSRNGGS